MDSLAVVRTPTRVLVYGTVRKSVFFATFVNDFSARFTRALACEISRPRAGTETGSAGDWRAHSGLYFPHRHPTNQSSASSSIQPLYSTEIFCAKNIR